MLAAATPAWAGDGYRAFTAKDGKEIRAKVLGYSRSTDMVQIERDNGKRFKVKAEIFCDKDQAIVRNWDQVKGFLADDGLLVLLERIETDVKEPRKNAKYKRRDAKIHYRIVVENKTGAAMDNLEAEVSMLILLESWDLGEHQRLVHLLPGCSTVESVGFSKLGAREKKEYTTQSVDSHKTFLHESADENSKILAVEDMAVPGVWVRIRIRLPDGSEIVRDFQEPESCWEGFEWAEKGPVDPNAKQKEQDLAKKGPPEFN